MKQEIQFLIARSFDTEYLPTDSPIRLDRKGTSLPQIHGIYFIWDRHGDLAYVGQATNLRQRLCNHEKGEIGDSVTYLTLSDEQGVNYDYIESYYIGRYRPYRNFPNIPSSLGIKMALKKAHMAGKCVGRPPVTTIQMEYLILKSREEGLSLRSIARKLDIPKSQVHRVVNGVASIIGKAR